MQKRKLGKTDIELSAIGFGGAPIGNLFKKLNFSQNKQKAVLKKIQILLIKNGKNLIR